MSLANTVHVVRTKTANTASVLAALRRIGAHPVVTDAPDEVRTAAHLVVPGVGAFAASMQALQQSGLVDILRQRLLGGAQATLGICMGLQVFCQSSEESPATLGIGAVHGVVRRFDAQVRVPQLGWNEVRPQPGCLMIAPGDAYFAHSYRLAEVPAGWHGALTEHGGLFVAALERGPMLLCQFHPELSGAYGEALLRRWLEAG